MRIINTEKLTLDDLPKITDLEELDKFALTFDIKELNAESFKRIGKNHKILDGFSLEELRASLFVEQRRWNHLGEPPDKEAMELKREIIEKIREKLIVLR